MKIVIPGGSGQVGTVLARAFVEEGHDVVVLSRRSKQAAWRTVVWDGQSIGSWTHEIEGADALINLTGRSVNCRYHTSNRREMMESRTKSTQILGQAMGLAKNPPRIWLQASTATIYAHRYDAPNDEATGVIGGNEPNAPDTWRFSIDVATTWERIANEAFTPQTRKVLLRSAMTMSPDPGGVFDVLLGLVRKGLGGTVGDGRQYMSWIHDRDFIRSVYWLIENEIEGPVNLAAPNPIPNADFMRILREVWGIRVGIPSPKMLLEIATFFMRTESELVLKSRRVVPARLLAAGFKFEFPTWQSAAADLCQRWRALRELRSSARALST